MNVPWKDGSGTIAFAIRDARIDITITQVSHVPMDASIEVDVFFVNTEKSVPRLSQKAKYNIVSKVRDIMLKAPSIVGPNPSIGIAKPIIKPIVLIVRVVTATVPARNLPFSTESLNIGWERTVERVPLVLSLFIASNPKAKPIIGPKKTINWMNEKPNSCPVNMARNPL